MHTNRSLIHSDKITLFYSYTLQILQLTFVLWQIQLTSATESCIDYIIYGLIYSKQHDLYHFNIERIHSLKHTYVDCKK